MCLRAIATASKLILRIAILVVTGFSVLHRADTTTRRTVILTTVAWAVWVYILARTFIVVAGPIDASAAAFSSVLVRSTFKNSVCVR